MVSIEYYRLEYNEEQGVFHYDSFSKKKDYPIGWETIAMVIWHDELEQFLNLVYLAFPQLNNSHGNDYPKTFEIRRMYNNFVGISDL